jgi:hypothetical protein
LFQFWVLDHGSGYWEKTMKNHKNCMANLFAAFGDSPMEIVIASPSGNVSMRYAEAQSCTSSGQ